MAYCINCGCEDKVTKIKDHTGGYHCRRCHIIFGGIHNKRPEKGDVFIHFKKGTLYEVLEVAKNCTNDGDDREYVIYKNFKSNGWYARRIDEFRSEVDHKKYPKASQRFRFEYWFNRNNYHKDGYGAYIVNSKEQMITTIRSNDNGDVTRRHF